jgi:hypothetical protein
MTHPSFFPDNSHWKHKTHAVWLHVFYTADRIRQQKQEKSYLSKAKREQRFTEEETEKTQKTAVNMMRCKAVCPKSAAKPSKNVPLIYHTLLNPLRSRSPRGFLVGVTGLEPAASWSQTKRATNCATPRRSVFRRKVYFTIHCLNNQ